MNKQKKEILKLGFTAGTRAIDNYDTCCDKFGFKKALRGNFAQQKMLYAKNATDEGYSVWMLAHSSLNESFNRKGRWYNIFVGSDVIRELWFNPSDISWSQADYSYRVCFAKTRDGNYVFKGIYKPQKIDWEKIPDGKTELVRTFVRISSTYPVGIEETIDENTEIMVSVEAIFRLLILFNSNANATANITMEIVVSCIPNTTPTAIPVKAECPKASLKYAIFLFTIMVPRSANKGVIISIANSAFLIKP